MPISDIDPGAVETLLDRAFGPDRHGRTAYRLRAGTTAIAPLSRAALEDGALVGSIQCWPVVLSCDDGDGVPMVLVGPVAVVPERQHDGIGRALMAAMLAVDPATIPGGDAMMLIGDPAYYGRFFGFDAGRTARWRLPGPFEPHRLLARGGGVPDRAGIVGPRTLA